MTMTCLTDLWKEFRLLSEPQIFLRRRTLLSGTFPGQLKEQRRIAVLLGRSGTKRVKFLSDFDWTEGAK